MRVLVACEFSGIVRDAFRFMGHDALSCDIVPSHRRGPHYQGDVRDILAYDWDMLLAFPPCRYLTKAGTLYRQTPGWGQHSLEALEFVMELLYAPIPKIALENPPGLISTRIRKPEQVIQPWQFGEPWAKQTCLWLKNLPKLTPTAILHERKSYTDHFGPHGPRSQRRSKTFPGIAMAMATQWG